MYCIVGTPTSRLGGANHLAPALGPSKVRTKSRERLLRTTLFYSGHLQNERERLDMERKHMNSDKAQRKELELATDGGGTKNTKQACLRSPI